MKRLLLLLLFASPLAAQTNIPITYGQAFRQGDITNCAQAYIDGVSVTTQNDVRNRWPDGSLKYAVISLILPTYTAGQALHITYDTTATCNNLASQAQTKAQLLGAGYNFDAQIQLTGGSNPSASAKTILTAASSCTDPGSDPEGSASLCTYWLKGPIVTGVIIEDRQSRAYDMNTDGGTGNPLHPIFECWFYPINNRVQCGYTLENIWASTTPTSSARVQTYSATLTFGSTSPQTLLTSGSITHYVRSRWHRTFDILQAGDVLPVIDHNWRYWETTGFTPAYDVNLPIAQTFVTQLVNSYNSSNQALVTPGGGATASGNWPLPTQFSDTGAAFPHGPLSTWDTTYLMNQSQSLLTVVLGNADLGGAIPYFHREADASAGHGQFFDAPTNTVGTLGRIVSINARTQVSLLDTTAQNCNTNFAADWINYGTGGQNTGPYSLGDNLSTSHSGQINYIAYLMTGQYHYYEGTLMQGDYGIGGTKGSRACTQPTANSALRMGSAGYIYVDQERQMDWGIRDWMLAAFIAVDGSPEKAYLEQKLHANVAVMDGARGLANDYPAESTAYSYGQNSRGIGCVNNITTSSFLGSPTCGISAYITNAPLNQAGASCAPTCIPASADAHFQEGYTTIVWGWLNDLGYMPSHSLLNIPANYYLNEALNPATNVAHLVDYVYPTADSAGNQITTWAQQQTFYATQTPSWPNCTGTADEQYGTVSTAAASYFYGLTSSQGGYNGATAWNKLRTLIFNAGCITNTSFPAVAFATASPKYDIVPRAQAELIFNGPQPGGGSGSPAVSFSPTSLTFGNQLVSSTSAGLSVTLTNSGTATLSLAASAAVTATGNFAVLSTTCTNGLNLAAGTSCSITVTFTPLAAGTISGTISVADNATGSPQTVPLTGTGILTPSPSSFAILNGTLILSGGLTP